MKTQTEIEELLRRCAALVIEARRHRMKGDFTMAAMDYGVLEGKTAILEWILDIDQGVKYEKAHKPHYAQKELIE